MFRKMKNHTGNVHFCSGKGGTPPPSATLNYSIERAIDEPPDAFQLFLAWLQIQPPRKFAAAAQVLGCSTHRLRRLHNKHQWKMRAADYDEARARIASRAFEHMLKDESSDWRQRIERFRLTEWDIYQKMAEAAHLAAEECQIHPKRINLSTLVRMCDLASKLGRRAVGMPLDESKCKPKRQLPVDPCQLSVEEALEKIYGHTATHPEAGPEPPKGTGFKDNTSPQAS